MPDDLYHNDILGWSKAQAERLRRLRGGERVDDLDWEHVIEEIEDVGGSQLSAVKSRLGLAMPHALKRSPGRPTRLSSVGSTTPPRSCPTRERPCSPACSSTSTRPLFMPAR
jgi:Domain of unknown function DUF29